MTSVFLSETVLRDRTTKHEIRSIRPLFISFLNDGSKYYVLSESTGESQSIGYHLHVGIPGAPMEQLSLEWRYEKSTNSMVMTVTGLKFPKYFVVTMESEPATDWGNLVNSRLRLLDANLADFEFDYDLKGGLIFRPVTLKVTRPVLSGLRFAADRFLGAKFSPGAGSEGIVSARSRLISRIMAIATDTPPASGENVPMAYLNLVRRTHAEYEVFQRTAVYDAWQLSEFEWRFHALACLMMSSAGIAVASHPVPSATRR